VDGSEESEQIIETAKIFSKIYQSQMSVVSLIPSFPGIHSTIAGNYTDTLVRALKEKLKESIPEISTRIKSKLGDHKAEVIVRMSCERDLSFHLKEIIEDADVNLAVLRKRSSSKLEQLILGSVSLRILELFKGNVLIFH
jgi:nucleotide-binding universal stress UspA family protein